MMHHTQHVICTWDQTMQGTEQALMPSLMLQKTLYTCHPTQIKYLSWSGQSKVVQSLQNFLQSVDNNYTNPKIVKLH